MFRPTALMSRLTACASLSTEPLMCCLQGTTLSAQKIVNFVRQRQTAVRKLTLMNSEGYWSGKVHARLWALKACQLRSAGHVSWF